jgi:Ca2+-binding RTX toxin-like protein
MKYFLVFLAFLLLVLPVYALDASEQSVSLISAGPGPISTCEWSVVGASTNDLYDGHPECDFAQMGGGADWVYGNGDGDWIYGDQGNDNLYGNGGPDYVAAGCRSSGCYAGSLNNLFGNSGNDILAGRNGKGGDYLNGGDGTEDHCWIDIGSSDKTVNCEYINQ